MSFSEAALVKQCMTGYKDGNRLQIAIDDTDMDIDVTMNRYK